MSRACQLLLCAAVSAAGSPPPLVPPQAVTFESLDVPALRPAVLPWDPAGARLTWSQTSSCCGYGPFTAAAVATASAKHGLFEPSAPCGWLGGPNGDGGPGGMPFVGEWGYEYLNNQNGIFPVCGNLTEAAYASPPADRGAALARMTLYWRCRAAAARAAVNASADAPVFSMIGHYLFAGLSAAIEGPGRIIPGSEIGENINSIQLHLAASRGAARQAGAAPFAIDFSAWFDGFILDYSALKPWGSASSPTGGHSLELFRRAYFATYFAGASGLIIEAGAVNAFEQRNDSAGVLELSPLGTIVAELFAFTHAPAAPGDGTEAARGIAYVPLALVMEQAHGMGLGWFYSSEAWDSFPLSDAEQRVDAHLRALWPGSFTVERQIGTPASESGYLVPAPLGDCADVLLPGNLTAAFLLGARYRAVVLAGLGAPVSQALATEVAAYVSAGGTAVLAADEAAAAAAAGWLPAALLGLALAPGPPLVLQVTAVTDVQTGWTAAAPAAPAAPFCASQNDDGSGAQYIKTGGDPTVRAGWDGGLADKCCSVDAATCRWFGSAAGCGAALPGADCRACPPAPAPGDVGCPAWSGNGTGGGLAVATAAATLTTAAPLLVFNLSGGGTALAATVNAAGAGRLVLLLAPGAEAGTALGTTAHLLSRLRDDTAPVALASNVSADNGPGGGGGGVQLQLARAPWGWLAALYNNNGVTKQPASPAVVDAAAGRAVTLTLLQPAAGGAPLASAWAQDGARGARVPLAVDGNGAVTVDIEPGGLRVVGLVLAAALKN